MIGIDLQGKIAFVTGGSRGIGNAIVKVLQDCGADLIAPKRKELDLSNLDSVDAYIRQHKDMKVDVFVHCAGINELAGINEISQDLLSRVYDVNLFAPIHLIQAFCPHMQSNKWGRIVVVSSIYGIVSRERRIAYSSSKNALSGLCKSLAIEVGCDNILVNCVAPGYVMTDMTKKNLSEEEIAYLEQQMPTKRLQTTEDIANLIAFLCSDLNQSITGQLVAVDGGFTCK